MDTITQLKNKISAIHEEWIALGDNLDDFKDAEFYEQQVEDLILNYCETMKYDVDGYPFLHRELAKTNEELDDDYFSDRTELYLHRLIIEKQDVFELYHFYSNLFWPDSCETEEDTRNAIIDSINYISYDFTV